MSDRTTASQPRGRRPGARRLPGRFAVPALACLVVIGGCAHTEQDTGERQADVSRVDVGALRVRGVTLVDSSDGRALVVVATILNDGRKPDTLTGLRIAAGGASGDSGTLGGSDISGQGGATGSQRGPGSSGGSGGSGGGTVSAVPELTDTTQLTVPAGGIVRVGGPGNPQLQVPDPQQRIRSGEFATLTLSFATAGTARMLVLVHAPTSYYSPYVSPSASPPGTPFASPSGNGPPSSGPPGTPSASPSGSP
jgi:hypothetical protein